MRSVYTFPVLQAKAEFERRLREKEAEEAAAHNFKVFPHMHSMELGCRLSSLLTLSCHPFRSLLS